MLWYPPAIALIYYAVISAFAKMLGSDKKSKVKLWIFILLSLIPLLFFKYFDYFLGVFGLDDYILEPQKLTLHYFGYDFD